VVRTIFCCVSEMVNRSKIIFNLAEQEALLPSVSKFANIIGAELDVQDGLFHA
jgi:hypothetical protein